MTKTKTKTKTKNIPASQRPPSTAAPDVEPRGGSLHALRETLESIVIAFVLAFLFRTFEAEAFVIPTGSMSPSLQGQHKDVCCTECGYRFRTTASSEGEDSRARYLAGRRDPAMAEIIAGMCPMCRQTMPYRLDLPRGVPPHIDLEHVEQAPTYPGDRVLVNKYIYAQQDPQRWDVVVFKFPGNGEMNYIKRLVGLPHEVLQIYQGDIFIRAAETEKDFGIQRKPADKVQVMLQPVHDTQYDPSLLYRAGWPLRWDAAGGWQVEADADGQTVRQQYHFAPAAADSAELSWLRYRHRVPTENDWLVARKFSRTGKYPGTTPAKWLGESQPSLIRDFNPYNARLKRGEVRQYGWSMLPHRLGKHWVSDLALVCDLEIEQATGQLVLDLVEGGQHFACHFDLDQGTASISVPGGPKISSLQPTALCQPGRYRLKFCNVDDRLLLWVDDALIAFTEGTEGVHYDVAAIYGSRQQIIPRTSAADLGDLAPVGIGVQGATLTVDRLQVLRDIYYIAVRADRPGPHYQDYPEEALELPDGGTLPALIHPRQLFIDPDTWPRFLTRQKHDFTLAADQFFVLGDNSPESKDCRLWLDAMGGGRPGGFYLDRRLLIGKAVCVFWPHSWGGIPGLKRLPGLPNVKDMRIVR